MYACSSPSQYVSGAISTFDDPRLQPRRSGPARRVDYAWARETWLHSKIEKRTLEGGVAWSVGIKVTSGETGTGTGRCQDMCGGTPRLSQG